MSQLSGSSVLVACAVICSKGDQCNSSTVCWGCSQKTFPCNFVFFSEKRRRPQAVSGGKEFSNLHSTFQGKLFALFENNTLTCTDRLVNVLNCEDQGVVLNYGQLPCVVVWTSYPHRRQHLSPSVYKWILVISHKIRSKPCIIYL